MPKRFTEISKWTNNKWFFSLSTESKLFWLYLLDSCDNVGVWEENVDLSSKIIGYPYSLDTLLKDFKKQIYIFKDNRKWWIIDFCDFQYGGLNEDSASKPIQSYISTLKKHGLWKLYLKGIHSLKEKEKDIEKDKVKEKEQDNHEIIMPFDDEKFIEAWDLWKKFKREQFNFTYKPIGEQGVLKDISDLAKGSSVKAIAIIHQSIKKGWKGLFDVSGGEFENITNNDINDILNRMEHGKQA